jgi:hypothetical protein
MHIHCFVDTQNLTHTPNEETISAVTYMSDGNRIYWTLTTHNYEYQ